MLITRDIVLQCCRELRQRDQNDGIWQGGDIPGCIKAVVTAMGVEKVGRRYAIAESYVKDCAVELVCRELR